jgi:UDP-N-acetylglucosamine 2-epimerase (non-hydrolysing)
VRIITVVGARPNFVKIGPLLPELEAAGIPVDVAFTGSRESSRTEGSDARLTFYGVSVPPPRWFLDVGSGTHAVQTGRALGAVETLFAEEQPDAAMVVGDVNSSLAAAIAAVKLGVPVIHLGAGLRCGSMRVPEEVNRALISRVSALHLAATEDAMDNLEGEGVDPARMEFVGDMMAESVLTHMDDIKKLDAAGTLGLQRNGYVLASINKPENLESPERLRGIIQGLSSLEEPVVIPDSVGLGDAIEAAGVEPSENLMLVPAVRYLEMLALERDAKCVVTDSGGVQVEACMVCTPCVTVRSETEYGATIHVGANRLVDASPSALFAGVSEAVAVPRTWNAPKRWDKVVSKRIAKALKRGVQPLS